MSPRHFSREFRRNTGLSPARAIERLRAETARILVEADASTVERIASKTGFADPERMRRAFLRTFGEPPQALKRAARARRIADATSMRSGDGARDVASAAGLLPATPHRPTPAFAAASDG